MLYKLVFIYYIILSSISSPLYIAVYFFLSGDLSRESLSKLNEQKRTKFAKSLEGLLNKIEATHPIQNSDSPSSKPPPPPVTETTPPKAEPPLIPDHEPTDYLDFEPAQIEEIPQEVYEAMEPENEIEQDLYEAPGKQACSDVFTPCCYFLTKCVRATG